MCSPGAAAEAGVDPHPGSSKLLVMETGMLRMEVAVLLPCCSLHPASACLVPIQQGQGHTCIQGCVTFGMLGHDAQQCCLGQPVVRSKTSSEWHQLCSVPCEGESTITVQLRSGA